MMRESILKRYFSVQPYQSVERRSVRALCLILSLHLPRVRRREVHAQQVRVEYVLFGALCLILSLQQPFSMSLFTEALLAEDGLVALALLLGVAAALEAAALEEASREGERRRRGEGAERGRVLVPGKVKENKT